MKKTRPTNINLQGLIRELRKKSVEEKAGLWKRIAYELERPTRKRRAVNVSRLIRYADGSGILIVPGKVFSSGVVDKKLTVAAWQFSEEAKFKIEQAGGRAITIAELIKTKPKPSEIRIIG